MPPRMHVVVPDMFSVYEPCSHDPGGKLLKLGEDAVKCMIESQSSDGDEERGLLERALELRMREHAGWLAVRTPEHPAGDMLGAAKAAAGIGVLHLKLLAIEDAREWLQRASDECPLAAQQVRDSIQFNLAQLEKVAQVRYVHRQVRLHGLVGKPEYNGLLGMVLCHKEARWKVMVVAPDNQPRLLLVRKENTEFV